MGRDARSQDNRHDSEDAVDRIIAQWHRERPELDVSGKGITGRITRLRNLISDRFDADAFKPHGLNGGDYGILAALRRVGAPHELTPTELTRHQMVTSGGMTAMLDRLERRGWIERVPNPNDRRGVLVRLTETGKGVVDAAMASHVETERALVTALSAREQEQLASLLRKLLRSLDPA